MFMIQPNYFSRTSKRISRISYLTFDFWSVAKLDPGVATTMAAEVFAAVTGCCPDAMDDIIVSLFVTPVPFVISESLFVSLTESMASAFRFRPILGFMYAADFL